MHLAVIFLPLCFLGVLFGLFFEGAPQIVSICLAAISFNVVGWRLVNRLDTRYVVYKFFLFAFMLQPIFCLLITLLYPESTEQMMINATLFNGGAPSLLYSFSLVPVVAIIFACICRLGDPNSSKLNSVTYYMQYAGSRLSFFLWLAAFINLSVWFEPVIGGKIGYGMRVLYATFSLTPLLAGYCWKMNPIIRYTWLSSLALGLIFAVVTGNRAYGFYSVIYYFIGFVFALPKGRKIYALAALLLIMPVGLFAVGFIQNLRNQIGRKALSDVNITEVINFVPAALEDSFARGKSNIGQFERSTGYTGLERLVDWTLVFVPNMTPSQVEYRGYNDYWQEFRGMVSIGGADLNSVTGAFYPTVLYARPYGFNVHLTVGAEGRLKSFTVPFGLIADSWSRAGPLSTIVQLFAAFAVFVLAEVLVRKLLRKYPDVLIMVTLVLAKFMMQLDTYALLITIRRMIVYMLFMAIICFIFRYFRKFVFPRLFAQDGLASSGMAANRLPHHNSKR